MTLKEKGFLIASRFPTPPFACAFFIPRAIVKCGHPVDGSYCQGCALLRKELEEDLVTHFQDFQNTSESSVDNTDVINAPPEPFVVKQDQGSFVDKLICDLHTFSPNQRHCFHCKDVLRDGKACQRCTCKRRGSGLSKGLCLICGNNQNSPNDSLISANSLHNYPYIDERCFECGDALDGIFCQQCACKSCGKGAHNGYNCPPKVPIISNSEPCNQTINNEPPQTLPSFDSTCYSDKEISNRPTFCNNGDDDEVDYTIAITLILSIEEPDNSLSMGEDYLDTIPATESDEVIKSSVEDLVPIPSESKGIPDTIDDDSLYYENLEYVEASPHDFELVSLEVEKIVIPKDKEIEDDNLREKLLKFPPSDRSDSTHEEFGDEPAHIISPPEYDCFYFSNLPDPGKLISSLNFEIRENLSSTTRVNLPIKDDYSPLLANVVWIFLAYLTYPIIPPHLYSFGNEDTIFDPGITINRFYSSKPGLSHRCGTFKKFNTHRSHLNESLIEILFSTLFLIDQ
nr:hypothetical protein [Tanacetum cinerariifolium]